MQYIWESANDWGVCCNEQIVDWMDRCRESLFRGKKYKISTEKTSYRLLLISLVN